MRNGMTRMIPAYIFGLEASGRPKEWVVVFLNRLLEVI
jgi:hypothetical protein